jgi:hypothetical protein
MVYLYATAYLTEQITRSTPNIKLIKMLLKK